MVGNHNDSGRSFPPPTRRLIVPAVVGLLSLLAGFSLAAPVSASTFFTEAFNIPTINPNTNRFGVINEESANNKGGEAVAIMDVNNDGRQDIVITNGTQFYHVALNRPNPDGSINFESTSHFIGETGMEKQIRQPALGVHDFDSNGMLDLYLANTGEGTLQARNPRLPMPEIKDPSNINDIGLFRTSKYRTYLRRQDGSFGYVDIGADAQGNTRSPLFADFDGDGNDDAYISNAPYYGIWWASSQDPNQLLPGKTDGTFADDMLSTAVVNGPDDLFQNELGRGNVDFKGTVVRDFDGDGKPDIIAGAYADVWDSELLPPIQPADPAGGLVDLDDDGVPDGGWQGDWRRGIMVLHNQSTPGRIRFRNVSATATDQGISASEKRMHVYVNLPSDIDGDGDLDLVTSGPRNFTAHGSLENQTPIAAVYRNDSKPGKIKFTNITKKSGLAFMNNDAALSEATDGDYPNFIPNFGPGGSDLYTGPLLSAGVMVDIDNDADPDWVAIDRQFTSRRLDTNEEYSLWVFRNDGTGRFALVPASQHGMIHTARELSVGDFNRDGRMDIVAVNGSGGGQSVDDNNYVFTNNLGKKRKYVFVRVMQKGNPLGLGSKVTVYKTKQRKKGMSKKRWNKVRKRNGKLLGYEELRTDFGYRSKRDAVLHFGLNEAKRINIVVEAPNGAKNVVRNKKVNRTHLVKVPAAKKR